MTKPACYSCVNWSPIKTLTGPTLHICSQFLNAVPGRKHPITGIPEPDVAECIAYEQIDNIMDAEIVPEDAK